METGPLKWDYISTQLGGVRTGKQCRERWHNQLNPLLKRNVWNVEEEWLLYLMKQRVSNHWSDMAIELLGRSDNTIKNYWNSNQKRFQASYAKFLNEYLDNILKQHEQN